MLLCRKCGKVIADCSPEVHHAICAACGFDEPPRQPEARPAWQRKAERQGGNLVGSGFLEAVVSGEEPLTEAEAETLSGTPPATSGNTTRPRPSV